MSGLELILPALGSVLGIGGADAAAAGTTAAVAGGLTGGAMASGAGLGAAAAGGATATAAAGGSALSSIGTITTLLGTGLGAAGAIKSGQDAKRQADEEAAAANAQAQESSAAGQRNALEQQKRTALLMSRQRALAAASGGSATDPGILDLLAETGAQGQYESDLARYEGDARAAGLGYQAALDRAAGSNAMTAGFINAGTTMLSGFNEWEKYRRGFYNPTGGYNAGSYRQFA